MSDIDALKSQIDAIGDITTASGKVTTGQWKEGANTCIWQAPAPGTYIILMVYEYISGTKQDYIQLHMRGNGTFGGAGASTGVFYYTENAGKNFNVCEIVGVSKFTAAGQIVYPYIHTGTAGIVYNVKITAVRIK